MSIFDSMYTPERDSYKNPEEGKTYISPQFTDSISGEAIRLVTRGIDQQETYETAKVKKEVILRKTEGGKKVIKARVYEDPRRVHVLTIQDYTPDTGNPHKNGHSFVGEEITKLFDFLRDVQTMRFGNQKYQRLLDDEIEHLELSDSQAAKIVKENPELFASIVQSNITTQDITAVAYRREQLDLFKRLLDEVYFKQYRDRTSSKSESVWQKFFEKNPWIFGYGLGYIFLTELDGKKLEQVVQGYDFNQHGKRIDAVMKTRGLISNLCFVEIKTSQTKLLKPTAYRPSCFAPSDELAGAVAQVQNSVSSAVKSLNEKIQMKDNHGNPTGEEIYNHQPRSYLVIGNLDEFLTDNGVNEDKLRSFELFRKNIISPEIITFDELYARAKFIVDFGQTMQSDTPQGN